MKENDKKQELLRKRAIELYLQNWKIADICSLLNCKRSWFYKWLKRYQSNEPDWYKEQSRAPKNRPRKTPSQMEQLVIDTRKQLASRPYVQYGPQAIYYALKQRGIDPPEIWTIARILKRHNLQTNKKIKGYIPKGKSYPYQYVLSQQMDFVGPRYLHSKTRFYFHNIICKDTHMAQISVFENQSAVNVLKALIRFWKTAGIPDFLQIDNFLSFWGSLIKPNAVGQVIRFCLFHGVTPVFIPIKEPWRNGVIEHFNQTMQQAILASRYYENTKQLQQAANEFCQIHNQTHHYSSQQGMTPLQCMKKYNYPLSQLDENYSMPQNKLPLKSGEIHIIRFIRSDRKFHIFGLTYLLPEKATYEYVRGVIIVDEQQLLVFKDQERIAQFPFTIL